MSPDKDRSLIARQHVQVINNWGLHARPSAAIASVAAKYPDCEITLHSDNNMSASALSVASLLMLEAVKGSMIEVEAHGSENAVNAVNDVVEIIQGGFDEEHRVLKGEGINCGIAIGLAHVLLNEPVDIPHYSITKAKIANERKRLSTARAEIKSEFAKLGNNEEDPQFSEFRQLLMMMLSEECFSKTPSALIRQELVNAEWALKISVDKFTEKFAERSSLIWQSRIDEYNLILKRMIDAMTTDSSKCSSKAKSTHIIITSNIGPAEVIEYHRAGYIGVISSGGSKNSHAAIVARSMGIPSILAIDELNLECIKEDTLLAIDSNTGELHIQPTKETVAELRLKAQTDKPTSRRTLRAGKPPRSLSRDGERIYINANIDFMAEIEAAQNIGAEGVGLFRTEFMFLGKETPPSEDEQFEIYSEVIKKFAPLPITFRTVDIGSDKQAAGLDASASSMGMRAIRYSLANPLMFKQQLRALIRASLLGKIFILLPMVTQEQELTLAHRLLKEAAHELDMKDTKLPDLGVMIEIPGVAYILDSLSKQCEFFSVGTNDLLQYTLAVDRNNSQLIQLSNPCHPGFLALLGQIIRTAVKIKKQITVCGELAADPIMVRFMLALGVRSLSMNPLHIENIRDNLREFRIFSHQQLALELTKCRSSEQAVELLDKFK